jgi:hypothetical protein
MFKLRRCQAEDLTERFLRKCAIGRLNFLRTHSFGQASEKEGDREARTPDSQLATQEIGVRYNPPIVFIPLHFAIRLARKPDAWLTRPLR